jgi:hypothetical protein
VINLQSYLNKKGCIVQIKNKDELCCARAIVVAKAKFDKDPQYKCIANNQKPLQGRLAHELHEAAGVPLGPCGIPEIKRFQAVLPGYQLNMVSKDHLNALIYSGPEADKCIYLYHHDMAYDVISSMPAFLARNTAIRARRVTTKLLTTRVAISANCAIFRTAQSSSGSTVKTATVFLRATNASPATKPQLENKKTYVLRS